MARAPRKPVRVAEPVFPALLPRGLETWDLSAVTTEELATVRAFLERLARVKAART